MALSLIQDSTLLLVMLTVLSPFFSFGVIMVFTRAYARLSSVLSVSSISVSLIGSLLLLLRHWHLEQPIQYAGNWLVSGSIAIPYGFLLDPTSLLMLTLVALISCLVQIYSLGYMAGDPGFPRYYAFQSLFAWAMMSLSISPSMLQLYVFWELVGLSSYLLIGFWYEKFSASQAGKKAFVMTRLGDITFFLGLLLVLLHFGNLNILEMNSAELPGRMSPALITLCALLIFGGIVGKSAQFPLMTWLPDAMEGPTPVSALLHSATMVAAGVYLFARLFPFFGHSPSAMTLFLTIGTITMLMASTMAMVNRDIKQVWAYSTISQLGFMVMGLAAGGYFAGTFHLTTHAGFKALLFLCSGVWIHQYETNDVFEISRRAGRMFKVPMVCIVIAAAALGGVPPLSGFFSKEAIMAVLAGLHNPTWLAAGLLGAFLTSYYAFRIIFIILFPRETQSIPREGLLDRTPSLEANQRSRAHYWVMAWPLVILACVSLALGFFQGSLENFLLGQHAASGNAAGHHTWLLYGSVGSVIFGVCLAWFEFGRKGSAQAGFVERIPPLRSFFAERWYLDHFYRHFVKYVIDGMVARLCARNEQRVIDGSIDGFCRLTVGSGRILSFLQSGIVRYNLIVTFAALGVLALYLLLG